MSRRFDTIEERFDFIEFRQELMFNNADIDRVLFEYEITRDECRRIMDLMNECVEKINRGEAVERTGFEAEIYRILPKHQGNYQMCELISQGFANSKRWEEVYTVLYGKFADFEGTDLD